MYTVKKNGIQYAVITNKLAALCEAANLHNTIRSDTITLEDEQGDLINFTQLRTTNDVFKALFNQIETSQIVTMCKDAGFNVSASKVKGWRLSADNDKFRKMSVIEFLLVSSLLKD